MSYNDYRKLWMSVPPSFLIFWKTTTNILGILKYIRLYWAWTHCCLPTSTWTHHDYSALYDPYCTPAHYNVATSHFCCYFAIDLSAAVFFFYTWVFIILSVYHPVYLSYTFALISLSCICICRLMYCTILFCFAPWSWKNNMSFIYTQVI